MLTTILLIIIGICIGGMLVIVVRKFPLLAQVEVKTIPKEKESSLKRKLLEERFLRKVKVVLSSLFRLAAPFVKGIAAEFYRWLSVITSHEKRSRIKRLQSLAQGENVPLVKTEEIMREVDALISAEQLEEAEGKLVEFVALHPRETAAYKRIAEIAIKKKEYEHAREVYEFITKLDEASPDAYSGLGRVYVLEGASAQALEAFEKSVALNSADAGDYFSLAKIYQTTGELDKALEAVKKAHELQPSNPKFLDKMAEIAILLGRKTIAKNAYLKLKKVNPENEKLPELKRQIDSLK